MEYNFLCFTYYYYCFCLCEVFTTSTCYSWLKSTFGWKKESLKIGETLSWGISPFMVGEKSHSVSMALSETSGCELGHAGGYVTPSENVSKGGKIRHIWKWDREERELHSRSALCIFFNRRRTDIWKMETCATDLKLPGIYGHYKALLVLFRHSDPTSQLSLIYPLN